MHLSRWTLRLLLPLLIIGVFLPVGIGITTLDYQLRRTEFINTEKQNHGMASALLAIQLESFLRINDLDAARRMLSIEATRDDVNFLVVVGEDGKVLLSNRYEWQGKPVQAVLKPDWAGPTSATEKLTLMQVGDHRLHTKQQISLLAGQNLPEPYRKVILLIEYDYAREVQEFMRQFIFSASVLGGLLMLLAAIIYALLRIWVSRPLERLMRQLEGLPDSQLKPLELKGTSEVQELARTLMSTTRRLNKSEHELGHATALLRSLIDGIPDLIHFKDAKGRYMGANDAYIEFLGLQNGTDLVGKRPAEIMPGQGNTLEQEDRQVLENRKAIRSEEWFTDKTGRKHLFETLKVPFTGPSDEIIGTIGISRDITERRMIEEQLSHSQKLEALGTLVAGIAHNFNNILAGILGKTYLARSKALSDETIAHLKDIDDLGYRAADLVKQLMAFARKDFADSTDINFSILCKETLKTIRIGMPEEIDFEVDMGSEEVHTQGVPSQLQQILFNLCNNARDSVMSVDGPKQITVTLAYCDRPASIAAESTVEQWCCLTVSDSGTGVSDEIKERIFEPFFTTKPEGSGTGLGLASTMGTVQGMGGTVEVSDTPGRGATFRAFLPASEESQSDMERTGGWIAQKSSHASRVLIVDDELAVSQTLEQIFVDLGYQVVTANNGRNGLNLFHATEKVDLVIADMAMPVLDGLGMMNAIWREHPETPCIFITGYAHSDREIPEDKCAITRLFQKPLKVRDIANAATELLDRQ